MSGSNQAKERGDLFCEPSDLLENQDGSIQKYTWIPDFWREQENPLFVESENLCAAWREHAAEKDNLSVRVGRWNIPGEPIVILVDFKPFFAQKNEIYTEMWNHYQVDSLHAYGDYDEASMFAFATGKVVESFYRYNLTETDKVVFQAHEWMTGIDRKSTRLNSSHLA